MKKYTVLLSFLLAVCFLPARAKPPVLIEIQEARPNAAAVQADWADACRDYILSGRFDAANALGLAAIRAGVTADEVRQVFHSVLWSLASLPPDEDCALTVQKAKCALYPLPALAADRAVKADKMTKALNIVVPYMQEGDDAETPQRGKGRVPSSYRTMLTNAVRAGNICMADFLLRHGADPRLGAPSAMQMARNPAFVMGPQMRSMLLQRQTWAGQVIRKIENHFRENPVR